MRRGEGRGERVEKVEAAQEKEEKNRTQCLKERGEVDERKLEDVMKNGEVEEDEDGGREASCNVGIGVEWQTQESGTDVMCDGVEKGDEESEKDWEHEENIEKSGTCETARRYEDVTEKAREEGLE